MTISVTAQESGGRGLPTVEPSTHEKTSDPWRSSGEFVIDGNLKSVEFADQLKTLEVPTLVIAGEDDPLTMGILREIHAAIAGSQLVILPRSKHFTFIDQTELFNQTVNRFIR